MNTIKEIRDRLGLTQEELAEGMGCTQGNVWHYEHGQTVTPPSAKRLIEFAAKKGMKLSFGQIYGAEPLPALTKQKRSPDRTPAPQASATEGPERRGMGRRWYDQHPGTGPDRRREGGRNA